MEIRRFRPEDAAETAQVVATTLRVSNSKDYPEEYITACIDSHSAEVLLSRAEEGHMYVVCEGERIIGCGTIAPFWGSRTESILLTIFVLPEYQGKGAGRLIIETLEKDEYFLRADRVEIPASLTAVEFYRKMGYSFKKGITAPDDELCVRLEKKRENIRFSQLTPESFEQIKCFFRDVFTKEPWNDDWSDDGQLSMYITELICSGNSLTFGLFDGEDLVGLSMGHIKHWYSGTEYYIEELCIATERQGKGLGTQFVESIEKALREMEIDHIFLQTGRQMPAYRFYLRNGFSEMPDHVSFSKKL